MRHLLVLFLFLGGLGYFVAHGGNFVAGPAPTPQLSYGPANEREFIERCGPPSADGQPVPVRMLASAEKAVWLDGAAAKFGQLCFNIQIQITTLDGMQAVEALLAQRLNPTVWAPENDRVLRYFEYRAKQQRGGQPPNLGEQTDLLRSPLVWLTTKRRELVRQQLLDAEESQEGAWLRSACPLVPRNPPGAPGGDLATMRPGRWVDWYLATRPPQPLARRRPRARLLPPEIDPLERELSDWGHVKFGHPHPTRTAPGLDALLMLSHDFLLPPASSPGDSPAQGPDLAKRLETQEPALHSFLRRCEAGVITWPTSGSALASEIFQLGGTKYDVVAVYEHMAIPVLRQGAKYEEQLPDPLRVTYPQPTLWSTHPAVVLGGDDPGRQRERAAARRWLAYLRSAEQQELAIEQGFRPGSPQVTVGAYRSPGNPFLHLQRQGIRAEVPQSESPTFDGETVAKLMRIWGQATLRYFIPEASSPKGEPASRN